MRFGDRALIWKGAAFIVGLLLLLSVLGTLILPRVLRPMAREKAVELLDKRFDHVKLEALDVELRPKWNLLPLVSATGKGFSISLPGHDPEPPFITMKEFRVELSVLDLLRDPVRVEELQIDELRIQIPPSRGSDEGPSESGEPSEAPPAFLVEKLVADGALLRILPGEPEKSPLDFELYELEVDSAGLGEPMRFDATLRNAKPPGRIATEGEFGPLRLSDPGSSPVSGDYVFQDADLSVFGGIGGRLRSEGRFEGVLGRIEVDGFTETPDFQLKSAGNPVPLQTKFHAVVDGTKGDTLLVPVEATLGGSSFHTEGGVSERPGTSGKTVCVDAEEKEGRIEDFLRLAMKADKPFMTGDLQFRSLVLIPPGEVDVARKLVLDGEFTIASALFPERKVQEKVDQLSETGRKDEAEGEKKNDEERAITPLREERVFSDMHGAFELEKGVMTLSGLSFRVPGASVTLRGTYGLVNEELDLHGELRLESKLSETTSGIKSFLLKLLDPLFETDESGAVIPIAITGKADAPSFGLDVGRTLTGKEVAASPSPPAEGWTKSIPSCVELLSLAPDAFENSDRRAPTSSLLERTGGDGRSFGGRTEAETTRRFR